MSLLEGRPDTSSRNTSLYSLKMGWSSRFVCHPQQIPTPVLHIEDIPFCNTFSFEGMIFVSLRHASESLGGLSFSLLHLHILNFYGKIQLSFISS
jgi:hypothetical protein